MIRTSRYLTSLFLVSLVVLSSLCRLPNKGIKFPILAHQMLCISGSGGRSVSSGTVWVKLAWICSRVITWAEPHRRTKMYIFAVNDWNPDTSVRTKLRLAVRQICSLVTHTEMKDDTSPFSLNISSILTKTRSPVKHGGDSLSNPPPPSFFSTFSIFTPSS